MTYETGVGFTCRLVYSLQIQHTIIMSITLMRVAPRASGGPGRKHRQSDGESSLGLQPQLCCFSAGSKIK